MTQERRRRISGEIATAAKKWGAIIALIVAPVTGATGMWSDITHRLDDVQRRVALVEARIESIEKLQQERSMAMLEVAQSVEALRKDVASLSRSLRLDEWPTPSRRDARREAREGARR